MEIKNIDFVDPDLNDLDIGYIGKDLNEGSQHTCLYFALSKQASLGQDPFNQFPNFLEKMDTRVFSITLPFHQEVFELEPWKEDLLHNQSQLLAFLQKMVRFCHLLVEKQLVKGSIEVAGLSRGGLVALHLARQCSFIKNVVCFAPLLDLEEVFQQEHPRLNQLNALHLIDHLIEKNIRIHIGNLDTRVNTQKSVDLILQIAKKAFDKKIRGFDHEIFIKESIGHMGHGTSQQTFEMGAKWLKEKRG